MSTTDMDKLVLAIQAIGHYFNTDSLDPFDIIAAITRNRQPEYVQLNESLSHAEAKVNRLKSQIDAARARNKDLAKQVQSAQRQILARRKKAPTTLRADVSKCPMIINGKQCQRVAGYHTVHRGVGRCKMHCPCHGRSVCATETFRSLSRAAVRLINSKPLPRTMEMPIELL